MIHFDFICFDVQKLNIKYRTKIVLLHEIEFYIHRKQNITDQFLTSLRIS